MCVCCYYCTPIETSYICSLYFSKPVSVDRSNLIINLFTSAKEKYLRMRMVVVIQLENNITYNVSREFYNGAYHFCCVHMLWCVSSTYACKYWASVRLND